MTYDTSSNSNRVEYMACSDCGIMVPEANLIIHQAHACGGRARTGPANDVATIPGVAVPVAVAADTIPSTVAATNSTTTTTTTTRSTCTTAFTTTTTTVAPEIIDISESSSPAKKPATIAATSKRSIVPQEVPPRQRQRQRTNDDAVGVVNNAPQNDDVIVVDLSGDSPVVTPARAAPVTPVPPLPNNIDRDDEWNCPRCTLRNQNTRYKCEACPYCNNALRPPDATRSERLVNGHYNKRGRSVADGMMEGAVSGAVGGAIADSAMPPPPVVSRNNGPRQMRQTSGPTSRGQPTTNRQQPRASHQVRQYRTGANGHLVNSVISSNGRRVDRSGDEHPLISLITAMGADGDGGLVIGQQQQQHHQNIEAMGYEQLLQAFGDGSENLGADEQVIHSLPISRLQTIEKELPAGDARQCCICLDDFAVGDIRKTLPCLHGFHSHCIDKALRNRGCCPICNFRV